MTTRCWISYRPRCVTLGQTSDRADRLQDPWQGTAEGVSRPGHLLVRSGEALHEISSGEAHLGAT